MMKFLNAYLPIFFILILAVPITQSHPATEKAPASTHTWKISGYAIRFSAGPVEYDSEKGAIPHSTYKVTYQRPSDTKLACVAPSAQDIETITFEDGFRIPELIKIFATPSGKKLLIDEQVPNDGGPCSNYILFERSGEAIKFSYILLPRRLLKLPATLPKGLIPPTPLTQQLPSVTSMSEDTLFFRYPDGFQDSLPLTTLARTSELMFP